MKFTWKAKNNDGWSDSPMTALGKPILFDTQEECYKHMRSAAMNKMKWNTNWEDFDDMETETTKDGILTTVYDYIAYDVNFYPNKIVHRSYSGEYVYEIVPVK